jgi:hypothetical protein
MKADLTPAPLLKERGNRAMDDKIPGTQSLPFSNFLAVEKKKNT